MKTHEIDGAERWNRRQFLAGGVGAALVGAVEPLDAANERPLKVGFLGTGYSHFAEKYRVIRENPEFELVGLAEADATVRARGPAGARWLERDRLLAEAEVIVVEGAVANHEADARVALEAGRHVHVEKPPAASLAGFVALQELAARQRCVLQVGYMWRHNPGLQAAFAAARAGWLGELYLVRATMNTQATAETRREWARFPGGAMFEQGCHLVDAVVRLLGRPTRVTPFLQHAGAAADGLADNTVAVFEYPRALALVTSAPLQPNAGPQRHFEVLGTGGTARVQPLEPPGFTLDLGRAAGPHPAGRTEVTLPAYRRYVDEFRELAAVVRGRAKLEVGPELERDVQATLMQACGQGG
jgi:predicted dehydrogenase